VSHTLIRVDEVALAPDGTLLAAVRTANEPGVVTSVKGALYGYRPTNHGGEANRILLVAGVGE
jgi:hypothetical protein